MKNVCIAGAGTAGFITGLVLKKRFGASCNITIIKSDKIGIIGVGEGSTEHWSEFMDFVGIDFKDIIKECNATLKLGIMFENWSLNKYFHSIDFLNLFKFSQTLVGYQKLIAEECSQKELNNEIFWENKIPRYFLEKSISPTRQYHFDTHKLNNFLQKKCIENNITVIDDEIKDVTLNNNGEIKNIIGTAKEYTFDFYIDCTGFKRILISKLDAKWESYKKYLKMNEAIIFPTENKEEINLYTTASAMKYGWRFQIPTYARQGNGYIFCNDYINADTAQKELETKFETKINVTKNIKFDPGALEKVWINNCVAIGLSANFVEPLEATSIGTSIQQAFLLSHYLPVYSQEDINSYNSSVKSIMNNIRDFIILHYLTKKQDSLFWEDIKNNTLPDTLKHNLIKWKNRLPISEDFKEYNSDYILFKEENFTHILYGLNLIDINQIKNNLNSLNKDILNKFFEDIALYANNKKENNMNFIFHKQYLDTIKNDNYTR